MQIKYFQDTDALLISFNDNFIHETKDINENTLVELDQNGNVVSMIFVHAKSVANINDISFQQLVSA